MLIPGQLLLKTIELMGMNGNHSASDANRTEIFLIRSLWLNKQNSSICLKNKIPKKNRLNKMKTKHWKKKFWMKHKWKNKNSTWK